MWRLQKHIQKNKITHRTEHTAHKKKTEIYRLKIFHCILISWYATANNNIPAMTLTHIKIYTAVISKFEWISLIFKNCVSGIIPAINTEKHVQNKTAK